MALARSLSPSGAPLSRVSLLSLLPYELKRHVVRECGLSPYDILWLSHVNRVWREVSSEESIFRDWYNAIPLEIKRILDTIVNTKGKRTLVMLALKKTCMRCKTEATPLISGPLLLRLCTACMLDHPEYSIMPDREKVRYHLTANDLRGLVSYPVRRVGKRKGAAQTMLVSTQSVLNIAVNKHGGTLESFEAHIAAKRADAQEEYYDKVADYDLGMEMKQPRSRPRLPNILKTSTDVQRQITSVQSAIDIGFLVYQSDGTVTHENMETCGICAFLRRREYRDDNRPESKSDVSVDVNNFRARAYYVSGGWGSHVSEAHLEPLAYPPKCPPLCSSVDKRRTTLCGTCCNRRVMTQINGTHDLDLLLYKFRHVRGDDPGPWHGSAAEKAEFLQQYELLGDAFFGSGPCRQCYTFHNDGGS